MTLVENRIHIGLMKELPLPLELIGTTSRIASVAVNIHNTQKENFLLYTPLPQGILVKLHTAHKILTFKNTFL